MFKQQNGITLVETLVTLILTSLVIMLIWTTVLTSMRHNIIETKKLRMQQEANYIISDLQRIQRKCSSYLLTIREDEISIKNCLDSNGFELMSDKKISDNYTYQGTYMNEKKIDAKVTNSSYDLTLTLIDPTRKQLEFQVETVISRYKSK